MLPNSLRINTLRSKLNGIFCHLYEMITAIKGAMQCKYIKRKQMRFIVYTKYEFHEAYKGYYASLTPKDVLRSKNVIPFFYNYISSKVSKIRSKIRSEIKFYSERIFALPFKHTSIGSRDIQI